MDKNEKTDSFKKKFLDQFEEPDFFSNPAIEDLKKMQAAIQKNIENNPAIITLEIDPQILMLAQRNLAEIGWTLEEAINLFLEWTVLFPERAAAWLRQIAMRRFREFHRPFREEDKIPASRLQSDEFEAVMASVQRDGIKVITDDEGNEEAILMAWWMNKALMQELDPEHATERIAEIEKACAEYQEDSVDEE